MTFPQTFSFFNNQDKQDDFSLGRQKIGSPLTSKDPP